MSCDQITKGTVLSATVIRFPGAAHAASAPFTLLLVEMDGGPNVLGHFDRLDPPDIGASVVGQRIDGGTLRFSLA